MEIYQLQNKLPFDLNNALDQEMEQSEIIKWSCQPSVSNAVKKAMPAVFFAFVWLAISGAIAVAMYTQYQKGEEVPIPAMAMIGVFILIGLLILTTPIWAAKTAKNTAYAVTNKRALIATKKGSEIEIQNYRPDELRDMDKRIRSDGSGDLIFEKQISYHRSKGRTRERVKEIGFFGIPSVNEVQDLIEALVKQ